MFDMWRIKLKDPRHGFVYPDVDIGFLLTQLENEKIVKVHFSIRFSRFREFSKLNFGIEYVGVIRYILKDTLHECELLAMPGYWEGEIEEIGEIK